MSNIWYRTKYGMNSKESKFAEPSFHCITVQGEALGSWRPGCPLLAVSPQTSYLVFLSFHLSKYEAKTILISLGCLWPVMCLADTGGQ